MKNEVHKVMLFISRESATFGYVRRQVERACSPSGGAFGMRVEIIDIAQRPDMAEKYNIEALPTIIIGNKRFVGTPTQEFLSACIESEHDASQESGKSS